MSGHEQNYSRRRVLALAGPGVRSGHASRFPAGLADLAPTVLTLMGLEPRDMQGLILADAMNAPPEGMLQVQEARVDMLWNYQDTLRTLTGSDQVVG